MTGSSFAASRGPYGLRFLLSFVASVLAALVVFVLVSEGEFPNPIPFSLSALFLAVVMSLAQRAWSGTIIVAADALVFKRKLGRWTFPWRDISEVCVTTLAQSGRFRRTYCAFLGLDIRRRFVEIRLKRWVKLNPITLRVSTRGLGIAIPFQRKVWLYPDNPEALVSSTQAHFRS